MPDCWLQDILNSEGPSANWPARSRFSVLSLVPSPNADFLFFLISNFICNLYQYISTPLYLIGSESSCNLGNETYKLNLKNCIYNYNNYILNLVGRSTGKFFRNRLVSGGSCRFKISSFGCTLRRLL
jgi:hypothetical protein